MRQFFVVVLWGIALFLAGFAFGVSQHSEPIGISGVSDEHILDQAFFAQANEFFAKRDSEARTKETAAENRSGVVVGSKNGSVYHLPQCSGARRIGEGNKIWFDSEVQARESGYRPAKTCPQLAQD